MPTTSPGRYFLADIFSTTGVGAAVGYAADRVFGTANLRALRASGATLPHDSLEVQAEMFWTSDFPAQFSKRRGYSVIRYLPALHNVADSSFDPLDPAQGGPVPRPAFDFTGGVGQRVRYDYDRTLTDLYVDRYLRTFTARAHALGLKSRVQVAYNYLPLNVTRAAEAVDVPETEGFDFGWPKAFVSTVPRYGTARWRYRIDAYRETAAGAHIAHHDRVTLEWGDDFSAYAKQPLQYADELNQAIAGGVTSGELASFTGVATQPWPLPTGLASIGFGDYWSTNWPQWRDWRPLATYMARSTEVVEQGRPRLDVAIYNDNGLSSVHESSPVWASPRLGQAGYTYEFVDPVSLASGQAGAVAGRLFGHGPDYRALVIANQRAMPADTARAILRMAHHGLHVVIVGRAPNRSTGLLHAGADDASVRRTMRALLRTRTVAHVSTESAVPGALRAINVAPAADFPGGGALMTVHRHRAGREIWWIYNPSPAPVTTTGSFAATGAPSQLDLWDGTTTPLAQYDTTRRRTRVRLTLAPYATTAVVFTPGRRTHVTATDAQAAVYGTRGAILLRDARGGTRTASLSDGRRVVVRIPRPHATLHVTRWHLHVDAISPGGATSHDVNLTGLRDWRRIAGLTTAVGTGTYTAEVNVPAGWLAHNRDVLLSIGGWITVRVDTTLLNEMVALEQQGLAAYQTGPTRLASAPSGLLGPVSLIPVALASARS